MSIPFIAVMIPTHNGDKLLQQAIDSVLAQGYRLLEVVVDDGSTDNTPEIIKQYDPEIVRYYYQKKRGNRPPVIFAAGKPKANFLHGWMRMIITCLEN